MNRIFSVVRMQLVNRQTFIWVPLIILAGSLIVTLAIYAIIRAAIGQNGEANLVGGGVQAPLWYFLGIGVGALAYSFPFSQALSITRREFFLGTMLTAFGASVVLATIFTVGAFVEEGTNGFGLQGYFFRLAWIWESGWFVAWLFWVIVAMLFFVLGFWLTTIFKRFGPVGLTLAIVGITAVLLGAVALITLLQAWVPFWEFLVRAGPLGMAGFCAVILAVLGASSYLTLRRAIP